MKKINLFTRHKSTRMSLKNKSKKPTDENKIKVQNIPQTIQCSSNNKKNSPKCKNSKVRYLWEQSKNEWYNNLYEDYESSESASASEDEDECELITNLKRSEEKLNDGDNITCLSETDSGISITCERRVKDVRNNLESCLENTLKKNVKAHDNDVITELVENDARLVDDSTLDSLEVFDLIQANITDLKCIEVKSTMADHKDTQASEYQGKLKNMNNNTKSSENVAVINNKENDINYLSYEAGLNNINKQSTPQKLQIHSELYNCFKPTKNLSKNSSEMVVTFDFIGVENHEVTILTGQIVDVLSKPDDDWWYIQAKDGREGFVPSTYLSKIPKLPERKPCALLENKLVRRESNSTERNNYTNERVQLPINHLDSHKLARVAPFHYDYNFKYDSQQNNNNKNVKPMYAYICEKSKSKEILTEKQKFYAEETSPSRIIRRRSFTARQKRVHFEDEKTLISYEDHLVEKYLRNNNSSKEKQEVEIKEFVKYKDSENEDYKESEKEAKYATWC